ncbi:MAG: XdhC family protein [Candidatus Muiribacteriota bacterium]
MINKCFKLMNEGIEFALCTVVDTNDSSPAKVGMKMIVYKDGSSDGNVGGGALEKNCTEKALEYIKKSKSALFELSLGQVDMTCGGKVKVFIETFTNPARIVVVGVGHIGREILRIACDSQDFNCVGFDSRKQVVQKYSRKYNVSLLDEYDNIEKKLTPQDFVVVLTHGHSFDTKVCNLLSKGPVVKYIGCIGSKNKVKVMKNNLKEQGVSEEFLNKLHAPVGIKIGGESPFDIAISILGEIISVKNMGESVCSMKN